MMRAIGGAVLALACVGAPALAEVPATVAVVAEAAGSHAYVAMNPAADEGQLATTVQPCADGAECRGEIAVPMERPVRLGKAQYSPVGEAVLNLLRSQGGGLLRP